MKTKDFVKLEEQLVEGLPSCSISGSTIVLCPVTQVLRGLSFEGSSFDSKRFFVWFFCLPLCVPTKHLYFNMGDRLRTSGGGDMWDARDRDLLEELRHAISTQAVPHLSKVETLDEVVQVLASLPKPRDPYKQQALAYALARISSLEEAEQALNDLLLQLDHKISWQGQLADRAEALLKCLKRSPTEAQEQLKKWEAQSIDALKLGGLCQQLAR